MALLARLAAALWLAGVGTGLVPFPGSRAEVVSPSRTWALRCTPADQTSDGLHHLLLVDVRTGSAHQVLAFGRSVEVAWAPDGSRFAVVNHSGSDEASTWVYTVGQGDPVDVAAAIERQQPGALAFTKGAHHLYVVDARWRDALSLSVRIWGYGGPKEFDRRLQVRLDK